MSDFDKEAERERLREKYEAEEEDREATEKMSELLLQGATMTNKHCDACGSPIFRYDGQEFCPTCEEVVGEAEGDQQPAENGRQGAADGQQAAGQQAEAGQEATEGQETGAERTERAGGAAAEQAVPPTPTQAEPPARQEPEPEPPTTPDPPARQEGGDRGHSAGDLSAARASLERTITRYARLAEEADDVGRAREYLAASREAAETLSAVRNA
jgi:uncharacterized Zn finger protein (UPF0148 family)